MKKYLFLFLMSFVPFLVHASGDSQSVNSFTLTGVYNTSAYDGTYTLLEENGFPKKACVAGIKMESLPEGYHYEWKILRGYGDEVLQVQPGTDFAYMGQNGNTDLFEFSISIIDESTGHPIMSRNIRFVFIEGFTKPIVPPIG